MDAIVIDANYSLPPTADTDAQHHPMGVPTGAHLNTPQKKVGPDAERDVVVELKNIHKTYLLGIEGVPALRGVSLKIHRGEFVAIYGTSGGGKTSLLNIMGTIDKPTKGELTICNTLINPKTRDEVLADIRLSKLGFVFQTFNLISSMSALENVELPMTLKGSVESSVRTELAKSSLEKVGMGHRLDHFPSQLSGGEQQRVTIARAIANNPDLLLLDEPTGDLDTENSHRVIDLLMKLNREDDMTMIMVTHDMYLKNFANRVVWMRDGKVARIETISAEKRARAFEELADALAQIKLAKSKKGQAVADQPTGKTDSKVWDCTEIRTPRDYKTFVFAEQRRQQQQLQHPHRTVASSLKTDSSTLAAKMAGPSANSSPSKLRHGHTPTEGSAAITAGDTPIIVASSLYSPPISPTRRPVQRRSTQRSLVRSHSFTSLGYHSGNYSYAPNVDENGNDVAGRTPRADSIHDPHPAFTVSSPTSAQFTVRPLVQQQRR